MTSVTQKNLNWLYLLPPWAEMALHAPLKSNSSLSLTLTVGTENHIFLFVVFCYSSPGRLVQLALTLSSVYSPLTSTYNDPQTLRGIDLGRKDNPKEAWPIFAPTISYKIIYLQMLAST
jgi:hypothetical protein